MGSRRRNPVKQIDAVLIAALMAIGAGCRGQALDSEAAARRSLESVGARYRPSGVKSRLPVLDAASALEDYLLFAMLNSPTVEAAYFDWAASVERITVERSLPDPRLTFEADIEGSIMSLMPGLMMDFPGPGKLRAAGEAAAAESRMRSARFEMEVLRTAEAVKAAYYRIGLLDHRLTVLHENLRLLESLEELARHQHAAGRVTLQDVLRAQIERERLRTEIENLEDSRSTLLAAFRKALGLQRDDPAPPLTATLPGGVSGDAYPDEASIWALAVERHPVLAGMRAAIEQAQARLALARRHA
jgi:outer membrane protein TolC